MGVALRGIGWVLAVVLLPVGIAVPAGPQWNAAIPLVTAFTHRGGPDELPPKARALALFGARHEAVLAAAVVLSRKGLLEHYGERANEIYCLAADEIEAAVLEERYDPGTHTYFVRVRSHSTAADFIRAQITDAELETQEAAFPYNREMEQPVMAGIHPAVELSRAYRHIRRRQWRIAIIYLDHLEKKYPYWGAMFLARAMAFRGMHRTKQMAAALERACGLNNQEACRELDRLAPNF